MQVKSIAEYCRMLQGEHSAILSTFIKLPIGIKTLVLSIFERSLKAGFTVFQRNDACQDLDEFGDRVVFAEGH